MSESPEIALAHHRIHKRFRQALTSIEDGHGRAAEELTASGTQLDLYLRHVSG